MSSSAAKRALRQAKLQKSGEKRRKAMLEAAMLGRAEKVAEAQVPTQTATVELLNEVEHEEVVQEAPAKPIRKRAQRLIEMAADELEQAELEFLDAAFETAREVMALHKQEVRDRRAAQERGDEVPKRWQVSPTIADRVLAKGFMIIEIRLARRRAAREQRMAG